MEEKKALPDARWQPPDKSFTKVILETGFGFATPNEGAMCTIQITPLPGKYHIDEEIIGYPLHRETETCVGNSDTALSEIFDTCLETMREGEQCQIHVPKSTLVRNLGEAKLRVMASSLNDLEVETEEDSTTKFIIELKSLNRCKEMWKTSAEEKIELAEEHKMRGTACFKNGQIVLASKRYSKALKLLITVGRKADLEQLSENMRSRYNSLKCSCLLNLSACLLKLKQYYNVVLLCNDALSIDSNNVKGLYRRGQALTKLNEFDRAKDDLSKAHALEPSNKAVTDLMSVLLSKVKQQDRQYALAMSKMFGGPIKM
ncbi:uncharacterized protein [Ptychodera flava]|uniref:uncharacterized protein n=1 Tax=Ptychodera flava TaxID=63121 RepID=UPI00396A59DE